MLHERSIAYCTFEEKSKLVQDSIRVQYVSELFHCELLQYPLREIVVWKSTFAL